jgi:hypothetical protein
VDVTTIWVGKMCFPRELRILVTSDFELPDGERMSDGHTVLWLFLSVLALTRVLWR